MTDQTKLEGCPLCRLPMEAVYSDDGEELFVTAYQHVADNKCALRFYRLAVSDVPAWNRRAGKDGADEKAGLTQASDSRARGPEVDLADMMNAPSGIGPYAHDWSDKPHRVLYDAVKIARALLAREGLREALEAFVGAAMYDAMMDGPRFKGWNRSELDRALVKAHAALRRAPGPQPASTNPKIIRTDVDAQVLVNTLNAARAMLAALQMTRLQLHIALAGKDALSNDKHLSIVEAAIAQAEAAGITATEVED